MTTPLVPQHPVSRRGSWELIKGFWIHAVNSLGVANADTYAASPSFSFHQAPTTLTGQVPGSHVWGPLGDHIVNAAGVPELAPTLSGTPDFQATGIKADNLAPSTAGANVKVAGLRKTQTTAVAITGATTLTLEDSGGIFSIAQSSAYDVNLPDPTSGPGCEYTFYCTAPGSFNVTLTVDGSATFVGTIVNDVTSVLPATGDTLTLASGVAALGDTIVVKSISTGLYHVQAISSANGGITVS